MNFKKKKNSWLFHHFTILNQSLLCFGTKGTAAQVVTATPGRAEMWGLARDRPDNQGKQMRPTKESHLERRNTKNTKVEELWFGEEI